MTAHVQELIAELRRLRAAADKAVSETPPLSPLSVSASAAYRDALVVACEPLCAEVERLTAERDELRRKWDASGEALGGCILDRNALRTKLDRLVALADNVRKEREYRERTNQCDNAIGHHRSREREWKACNELVDAAIAEAGQ